MRRLVTWIVFLLAVLYGVGAVVFVGRDDDRLRRADAIVVLAGSADRLPEALSLARRGIAPTLLVSEDTSGRDPAREALCRDGIAGVRLLCRPAAPFSTRGEVRMVAGVAHDRGWKRIVLVTSRYHLFRAVRLIRRCTDVELVERGTSDPAWKLAIAIPLEWAKLALAETLRRGC